ncbi:MAG: BamA/TamA family outer membrane protein [Bacteroidetes bacterium]|nr:BamA/TamA family outer membrane protein [Bacteroidota bacterium]MBS1973799.1 BamA/TamA family outer membrane protein [Bacteroidota bacterium]
MVVLLAPFHRAKAQLDTLKLRSSRSVLVLPVVARSIETSWSFGLASSFTFHINPKDRLSRTSNLQALALYSLRKQFVVAINGSIYFPGEKYILNQQLSYSYYPDKFWGLGKTSADSSEENYSYKQYYIYLHPQTHLGNKIYVGLLYEFQRLFSVKYDLGGLFDRENIYGRNGYHVSGFGASFTYDTRNNAFSPDKGEMLQFYFNHFANYFGSDYNYTNFVVDTRKFLRTHRRQVLAVQATASFNAGEVPLRSLALLGGSSKMRGYYEGRYRDKNLVVIQAEYRLPLFWRFSAVGFGGIGNVSDRLSDMNFQYLKYSFGTGLRFALNTAEKLNLRLDYGIGAGKSNGFYLQLGEAF